MNWWKFFLILISADGNSYKSISSVPTQTTTFNESFTLFNKTVFKKHGGALWIVMGNYYTALYECTALTSRATGPCYFLLNLNIFL